MKSQEDGTGRRVSIVAAWLSPGTGSSWGRVANLGTAVVLATAVSLLGVEVDYDMAVCRGLWELLKVSDF